MKSAMLLTMTVMEKLMKKYSKPTTLTKMAMGMVIQTRRFKPKPVLFPLVFQNFQQIVMIAI